MKVRGMRRVEVIFMHANVNDPGRTSAHVMSGHMRDPGARTLGIARSSDVIGCNRRRENEAQAQVVSRDILVTTFFESTQRRTILSRDDDGGLGASPALCATPPSQQSSSHTQPLFPSRIRQAYNLPYALPRSPMRCTASCCQITKPRAPQPGPMRTSSP